MLGVSRKRVHQLGDGKRLRFEIAPDRTRRFHRADVTRLAAERAVSPDPRVRRVAGDVSGIVVAEIFECFDREMTLPQIVAQTRHPPQLVRHLFDEWRTPLGAPAPERIPPARSAKDRARSERERDDDGHDYFSRREP